MITNTKIIILHGWMHNKRIWEPFAAKFDNASTFDLPGFGDEPLPSYSWGIEEYTRWVIKKLERTKDRNIVLIGHSFGGRIASYLASQRPAWLSGLVLIASPSIYRPSFNVRLQNKLVPKLKYLLPDRIKTKVAHLMLEDDYREIWQTKIKQVYERVVRFNQTEFLPTITVPTLILWGENDKDVKKEIQEEICELIPHSIFEIIPGSGHNIHLEKPNLLYGKISHFVETL